MITHPTPQRQLRGHMPQRPTPRTATSGEHHAHLAARLTPRDRWLARMLYEHRVLTTDHIVNLCYPSARAANHRLLELFHWRVIDRFQPFITSGTSPMHYVLDIAGAVALAYEDGLDPKKIRYRHEDAIGISHSLRLAHTVGINTFFASLVAASRQPTVSGQLTAWWSERRCEHLYGDIVRPDAYGRWRERGQNTEFFLEYDTGTEPLNKLADKLHDYYNLATTTGITTPVLVLLVSNRRETTARNALAAALSQLDQPELVPVATSTTDLTNTHNLSTPTWLPINGSTTHQPTRTQLPDLTRVWPHLAPPVSIQPATHAPTTPPTELAAPNPLPPSASPASFQHGDEP